MCRKALLSALPALVLACGPVPEEGGPSPEAPVEEGCAYPMANRFAVDAPIPPFAWAEARDPEGEITRLDLAEVHHDQDLQAKILAFVAIPSW